MTDQQCFMIQKHPACMSSDVMATVTPLNLHQSINRLAVNLQPLQSALGINIREQACCSVAYVKSTGWRYSCFPLASRIKAEDMFCNSPPCCNDAGFLQKNNSLDEKSRMVKESAKNQMSRDNNERFTRAETDFSNLFSRGNLILNHSEPCFHTHTCARERYTSESYAFLLLNQTLETDRKLN